MQEDGKKHVDKESPLQLVAESRIVSIRLVLLATRREGAIYSLKQLRG